MKNFLKLVLLISGLVLVAFGNDWGLLGLLPSTFQMFREDSLNLIK